MTEKACLYARVSTEDQDIDSQIESLENWAEKEGYDYDLFSEKVSSVQERPKFNELIDSIQQGDKEYDVLIVTDLDRFGRSTRDILQKIDLLEEHGTSFVCIDQGIDTRPDSPMGKVMQKVMITILSAFAEFERKMMLKRQKEGIAKAKKEGRLGRPKVLDEEHEEKIKEWYGRGVSGTDIKRRLEDGVGGVEPVEIGKSTVYDYLRGMEDESN